MGKPIEDLDKFIQEVGDLLAQEKITVEEFIKRLRSYHDTKEKA